jgi:hypothetical protein
MAQRSELYFNLHKQCLSVRGLRAKVGDRWFPGTPVAHFDSVVLHKVKFVVQPAGREKVRATKRKNVHAFVRGVLVTGQFLDSYPVIGGLLDAEISRIMLDPSMIEVTYNPYKFDSFVNKNTLTPVYSADKVYVVGKDIYAVGAK